ASGAAWRPGRWPHPGDRLHRPLAPVRDDLPALRPVQACGDPGHLGGGQPQLEPAHPGHLRRPRAAGGSGRKRHHARPLALHCGLPLQPADEPVDAIQGIGCAIQRLCGARSAAHPTGLRGNPMTETTEPQPQHIEGEVILEPGDPGYVAPEDQGSSAPLAPPEEPNVGDPLVAVPAGEDLQHYRQPTETDAEFLARTRNVVVNSQSPTDIVPNTPQATMGPRYDVEGTEG